MTPETDIRVIVSNEQQIKVDQDRIAGVAVRTARSQGARGEISITLVDEERMAGLHLDYMNEPGATDVLSFPIDGFQPGSLASATPASGLGESSSPPVKPGPDSPMSQDHVDSSGPPVLIGEVVICPAVAAQAGPDLHSELDLLVAHGVLHLVGHDHDDAPAARRMRAAEKKVTGRSGARAR